MTGCKIMSLPPASSRSDGGPVITRGVIVHEARSQARLYRDAAGCQSVQTDNRQFRVVTIETPTGRQHLVLEEAYDIRHCLDGGSASSEATITAWRPDSDVTTPLFRISGRGVSGSPIGNLYRLVTAGCCGSATLGMYYSLITGQFLFGSTRRPLVIDAGGELPTRYIGFHGTSSTVAPIEATVDSSVIGVLQIGDDREPARRVVLVADRPEPYVLERLSFARGGRALSDTALTAASNRTGIQVLVSLRAEDSGRTADIVVPIERDSLVIARAVLPPGVRIRGGR